MSRVSRLSLKGTVASRADAMPLLIVPGDAVLISRVRPRSLVVMCPCGCGVRQPINLDARTGAAWRLYRSQSSRISIFPSVWRTDGCKSHYVIWNGRILLFDQWAGFGDEAAQSERAVAPEHVLEHVRPSFRSLLDISDDLLEVPWGVLNALRVLQRQGKVEEGAANLRSYFRLARRR